MALLLQRKVGKDDLVLLSLFEWGALQKSEFYHGGASTHANDCARNCADSWFDFLAAEGAISLAVWTGHVTETYGQGGEASVREASACREARVGENLPKHLENEIRVIAGQVTVNQGRQDFPGAVWLLQLCLHWVVWMMLICIACQSLMGITLSLFSLFSCILQMQKMENQGVILSCMWRW